MIGTVSNRSAIGAKVRVKATIGGKTFWQLREISTVGGFGKQDLRPHFSLSDATLAETIRIEWPSGTVQEFKNVSAKQILTITEPPKLVADRFSSGEFRFRLLGARGLRYRVEISTNLRDWTGWLTVTNTNRFESLSDTKLSNISRRFYRVIAAPEQAKPGGGAV